MLTLKKLNKLVLASKNSRKIAGVFLWFIYIFFYVKAYAAKKAEKTPFEESMSLAAVMMSSKSFN